MWQIMLRPVRPASFIRKFGFRISFGDSGFVICYRFEKPLYGRRARAAHDTAGNLAFIIGHCPPDSYNAYSGSDPPRLKRGGCRFGNAL